jgi:hypothetical protein
VKTTKTKSAKEIIKMKLADGSDMKNICGIVIGETSSPEEANKRAEAMKNCPYIVVLGTTLNRIYFVFIVPSDKERLLRYSEANPKETGLEKATSYIVKNVICPGEFAPVLSEKKNRNRTLRRKLRNLPVKGTVQLQRLSFHDSLSGNNVSLNLCGNFFRRRLFYTLYETDKERLV